MKANVLDTEAAFLRLKGYSSSRDFSFINAWREPSPTQKLPFFEAKMLYSTFQTFSDKMGQNVSIP